jgi:hypothetical protein
MLLQTVQLTPDMSVTFRQRLWHEIIDTEKTYLECLMFVIQVQHALFFSIFSEFLP